MATRKNAVEEERMTDANLAKVILMLNPPEDADFKAWTKKEACQFLGMTYNTTRLGNILEKFQEKKAKDAKRRAEKRGKPATPDEIAYAIGEYISGNSIESISNSIYRSADFIKRILQEYAVPIKQTGHSYFKPALIPEGAMRDRYAIGEVVYSARYDTLARIEKESKHKTYGYIYNIWLKGEKWQQFAYQPACELASLEHLRKLGVKV